MQRKGNVTGDTDDTLCVCVFSCLFCCLRLCSLLSWSWLTFSPEVIHGLNHSWRAVCSILPLCPVGTSAAHTDNLVLNKEEHGLRIWSNYLYIRRLGWSERISAAGSMRTSKWGTWELARAGWGGERRIETRGIIISAIPFISCEFHIILFWKLKYRGRQTLEEAHVDGVCVYTCP